MINLNLNKMEEKIQHFEEIGMIQEAENSNKLFDNAILLEKHLNSSKLGEKLNLLSIKITYLEAVPTNGGMTGTGASYLVKADLEHISGDEDDLVIAKLTDHNKYATELTIYEYMTDEQIKVEVEENIDGIIECIADLFI